MYYGLIADHKYHGHSREQESIMRGEKGGGRGDISLNGRKEVGDVTRR